MTNIDNTETPNIKTPLQGDIVDVILEKMGGIRPTAQKLNISVSTVQGWKQRRMIPHNRIHIIDTYFKENFNMSLYDIAPSHAQPHAPKTHVQANIQADIPTNPTHHTQAPPLHRGTHSGYALWPSAL